MNVDVTILKVNIFNELRTFGAVINLLTLSYIQAYTMSIRVNNISKYYGAQAALNDVSFEVETGQVIGLLGPNGAGKSTMMKILAGFIPPSSGEAFINEFNVVTQSLNARRNVGYLPEHNPLYLDMYVREYLTFVANIYKLGNQTKKSVEAVIERTGLTPESSKKIGQLSKGYRQRVGLAQALVHNPAILILDEPTSGLDPNQLTDIRKMITDIGKEKTIVLSTHIMQEVEAMCSKVIIVSKGKIVANDTPKNVRQQTLNSGNPVKVEFTEAINKNIFANNPAIAEVTELTDKTYLFSGNSGVDIRPVIFQMAVESGYIIVGMEQKQKHLEEVFQELTKTSAITQQ